MAFLVACHLTNKYACLLARIAIRSSAPVYLYYSLRLAKCSADIQSGPQKMDDIIVLTSVKRLH